MKKYLFWGPGQGCITVNGDVTHLVLDDIEVPFEKEWMVAGPREIRGTFVPIYLDPEMRDWMLGIGWKTVTITDNSGEPWDMRVFRFQEPGLCDYIPMVDFKTGKIGKSRLPWWILLDEKPGVEFCECDCHE